MISERAWHEIEVEAAVRAECEKCAKIAETFLRDKIPYGYDARHSTALEIAAAIRQPVQSN
jgi:hypothetical protein